MNTPVNPLDANAYGILAGAKAAPPPPNQQMGLLQTPTPGVLSMLPTGHQFAATAPPPIPQGPLGGYSQQALGMAGVGPQGAPPPAASSNVSPWLSPQQAAYLEQIQALQANPPAAGASPTETPANADALLQNFLSTLPPGSQFGGLNSPAINAPTGGGAINAVADFGPQPVVRPPDTRPPDQIFGTPEWHAAHEP